MRMNNIAINTPNMLPIMISILGVVMAKLQVNHMVQEDADGRLVHMDVIYDYGEKTVMVVIGDVSMYEKGITTVNFHDYNTGYGVLKEVNKKLCVMTRTPVPIQPEWKYQTGYTNEVHYHQLHSPKLLSHHDVANIGGQKLAEFCKDYVTVLAQIKHAKTANWCLLSVCEHPLWENITHIFG
ncbi:uncharacterized protein LOC127880832 isoform X2 [Dreissena polymorpha]|uniref:uncharacterized protein LOC127880832 isoform X2 n=1 Tax=Dreissena polymorpha TaxID=45954 RepID=UPI00226472F8|nr:uncharacterized protein LOC127880832 isoform X2 [Dreissena polymorpha]